MPEPTSATGAVFLSYASQDAAAAARICETLRAAGIEVWFDQSELRGGDAWDSKIKKQIHNCALFVPVISAHTNARAEGYFRREWKFATRRLLDLADDAAFLVPVVIDDMREADARVPEEFLRTHWTRLQSGATPPAFTHHVRQLLGAESAPVRTVQSAPTGQFEPVARGVPPVRPWFLIAGGRSKLRARVAGPVVIALLLILVGGAFWYYQTANDAPAEMPALNSPAGSTGTPVLPAMSAVSTKTIAVLPFVNMSSDQEQEYFSDGLSEELLNLLAKVPELRVAARTSSFYYKGKDVKLPDIARELQVAHLLEGSVRKSGNRIRITTQLIRASDGYHEWSETYDRKLEDVFSVQEEIATAVVSQLKVTLLGVPRKIHKTTPEAYALYLQAMQLDRQGSTGRIEESIALYRKVIAIDPGYAPAWLWLGGNLWADANLESRPTEEVMKPVREAIGRALAIDPDYAAAHAALGAVALYYDHDHAASARHFEHALALDPTDPIALSNALGLNEALGRMDKSVEVMEYLVRRDPMLRGYHSMLGAAYLDARRFDDAIGSYRAALQLAPDAEGLHSFIADALLLKGQFEAALAEYMNEPSEPLRLCGLAFAYYALGKEQESEAALDELIENHHANGGYLIALVHVYRGEFDRAFEWLYKEFATFGPLEDASTNLWLKDLHGDPRWLPFLRKMGKAPEQVAAIKFELKVPTH